MESLVPYFFFHQWQRKLVALVTATVIWIFVNHTITATKTIPSVPIRVINLPNDKTIQGLLPNGFLTKRATLTLSGTKDVIEQLEPGDLEIILDVSNQPSEGFAQINKKNLVSLNPNINLLKHITSVTHPEISIKMSPLLTEQIPIIVHTPIGEPPKGYEFLDIWPLTLTQTVSGPQDQVLNLKHQGLELVFNLDDITKEQLDAIQSNGSYDDEVSFFIPEQWKKVTLPFSNKGGSVIINDPESKWLQINFLRQQLIAIPNELPIHVFYPLQYSETINPQTYPLVASQFVQFDHFVPFLKVPLFASHVSKLFVEIVKDSIELDIVTAPQTEREKLEWGISFVDDKHLEDTYVAFLLSNLKMSTTGASTRNKEREKHYRQRFRTYMQQMTLYLSPQRKLEVESRLDNGKIRVHIPYASPSTSLSSHAS